MTDEQMRLKESVRRLTIVGLLLIALASSIAVWCYNQRSVYEYYLEDKRREANLQAQMDSLSKENNRLYEVIEENGKELVSFTENKIMYVNLASELAIKYNVRINQLSVGDVVSEGEMSSMTTIVEIEGKLEDIRKFVTDYCGTNYTNRIEVVSCRPNGRYAWLARNIDGENILAWFDLTEDKKIYEEWVEEGYAAREQAEKDAEAGIVREEDDYIEEVQRPVTADELFEDVPLRVFMSIDFLGRA